MTAHLAKLATVFRPKRPWVQFSLATIFVVVAVAAVPCVWMASKMEAKRNERAVVASIRGHGGECEYPWENQTKCPPPGPEWVRSILGNDIFSDVNAVRLTQLTDLRHLERLTGLQMLTLDDLPITDSELKHLEKLVKLEMLSLCGTEVTDSGLERLRGLRGLEILFLDDTPVTNEGIRDFQKALPKCYITWGVSSQNFATP
jgi:hypothetical protein